VTFTISLFLLYNLYSLHGHHRTISVAGTALDALFLVDDMLLPDLAGNGIHRTGTGTLGASDAGVRDDIGQEVFADA
jgi:hypothetical protein